MGWIEDISEEFRARDLEQGLREQGRHDRLTLFQEQGPRFFEELRKQIVSGLGLLAEKHAAFKSVIPGEVTNRSFSFRNPEARPIINVIADLTTVDIIIRVETREAAGVPSTRAESYRISFGIDKNNLLSFCMQGKQSTIDDIAKIIICHLMDIV